MKLLYISLFIIASFYQAKSQGQIKNSSFDTWYNTSINIIVPADWKYDDETFKNKGIERHQPGSGLRLNLHSRQGQKFSTEVFQKDTLKVVPSAINFFYNVFNYNQTRVNRLDVSVTFYKDSLLIKEYKWNSAFEPNTNDLLKNISIHFDEIVINSANLFKISIKYADFNGHADEYAVVDDINFIPGNRVELKEVTNSIANLYPNPTNGIINFSLSSSEIINQVIVTSIDGKQTTFKPTFNNSIDFSSLAAGIYTVAVLNENDKIIGTQKVVLTK